MAKELPLRSEIAAEYKWKLEDIYASDEKWEEDFIKAENLLKKVPAYQGKLVTSAANLLAGIELIMEIEELVSKLYAYAHMREDEDTSKQHYQALHSRAQGLYNRLNSEISFMIPEILTLNAEQVQEFMQQEKGLALYEHLLNNILRQKEHFLSAAEEKILAMVGDLAQGPDNIFGRLNNADLIFPTIKDEQGEEVRLTHGRYLKYLESKDRRVRRDAFKSFYSKYAEFNNTFASILDTAVKAHVFYARVRKYNSALEAALDDDNIPVKVYNNLITTIKENLKPMHKYMSLRKEILGLDQLHLYDIYTPLVPEIDLEISYSEAQKTILEALQPLGEEYLSILRKGFSSGWIDVYENKGKRSGAYSSGCYGVHPYVLLNYTENLDNMFTLAHEMGHALHSYYSNENQPYVYANYKIFVAEVASTLNENLLIHHLLQNTDDETMQKRLINHYLEQFRGTVYRQTMFAEFEKIIHEEVEKGVPLTAGYLQELYHHLNEEYYGPEVVIDEEIDLEWARIPHFYYNFYVYKYATGFAAATALAKMILQEGKAAQERYLNFLKSGGSDYPIELLRKAGVDMESPAPIEAAVKTFQNYVEQLSALS